MAVPSLGEAAPKRGNGLSRGIGRTLLKLIGWRIVGEMPNQSKLVVIAAPHTSNWDFPVAMIAMFALGIHLRWLGKDSLFKGPMRYVMGWMGGIPVVRNQSSGFVDQAIDAFEKQSHLWLGISPEGTRQTVKRWRTGFYHIAHGANVPIFPVTLDFGRKQIALLAPLMPSGDITADFQALQSHFKGIVGKRPSNM